MAIALPIFHREIQNFAQISTIFRTIILHPYFGFLLVQTRNNENHGFPHFFPRIHCFVHENEFNWKQL